MKSFFVSLAVFVLLIALITANYFYVTSSAKRLSELCGEPPCLLSSEWNSRKTLLRVSIGRKRVNEISDLISELLVLYGEDDCRYSEILALTKSAFDDLAAFESPAPGEVF